MKHSINKINKEQNDKTLKCPGNCICFCISWVSYLIAQNVIYYCADNLTGPQNFGSNTPIDNFGIVTRLKLKGSNSV